MMNLEDTLYQVGVLPVIRLETAESAVPLAKALRNGGLPAAEITFRSDAAAEAIRRISREVPEVYVCAGTVLDPETAALAHEAGARAIITPGIHSGTMDWCEKHEVPVVSGCATPSEVEVCMRRGMKLVKFFPAEVMGGVAMLKALAGPYPHMKFMPTGGVKPANLADYLRQTNVAACGGTWIVPPELLKEEKYDEIEALARAAAALRDVVR